MIKRKYFGTDGIRGHVGDSLVNPEFVMRLGWAIGKVLATGPRKTVLIGKDTRISGYLLESALEAGISAAGVDIKLLGPMPTPAIAYLTRTFRASVGIVISASHNLYHDNGIKLFSAEGKKISDELELAVEAQLEKPMTTVESSKLGKASRIDDAPGRYIEYCKSTIPSSIRLDGMKIVIDCANGATYHIATNVFEELGAEVVALAVEPDGFNINAQCGSTKPEILQQIVQAEKADLGIAFDGDGDRVVMVDHKGETVDGDDILYIIAKDYQEHSRLQGGVVGTVMSNLGLELALNERKIPFQRSDVGDRHVIAQLEKANWFIGGEPSGHILCLDKTTTGDGIVAALQVLSSMYNSGKQLSELKQGLTKYPQVKINVGTLDAAAVMSHPNVQKAVKALEKKLHGYGRVLLRPSGTEPVTRVMVEGDDDIQVSVYAQELAAIVEQAAQK